MELFRFIAWQWNRFNFEEISLILSGIFTITVGSASVYMGLTFGWILFNVLLTLICTVCFCSIVWNTREQWRKYKAFKEKEAQQIVDKLRGRSY